jgi:hypothetical protein
MISIDDRIAYYIGNTQPPYVQPTDMKSGFDVPIHIIQDHYYNNYKSIHPNTAYPIDVVRFLRYSKFKKLWFQCGDSPYTQSMYPVFVKVRDMLNPLSKGIITSLESPRHWADVFKYEDTQWETKSTNIIWRGADTGRGIRLDFVKKFIDVYDVGFSEYVQDGLGNSNYLHDYLKPKVTIPFLINHKYIIVIDGNDKSSSLGWVLACNSVPIMPVPRYHSWLCEKFLIAGFHYVEVARDFSDLPEKIAWCQSHDEECKKIAIEGQKFMMQFSNKRIEDYIESKLVEFCESNY